MSAMSPRPSTRLAAREPPRKRRRAPPPLSVTNVFSDPRLPRSSDQLWRWPVATWYFGDLAPADLQVAADRPFIRTGSSLPPVANHYRLKWLEQDAHKLVNHIDQPLPQPLPLLPYARQKDTTACSRPSRGLRSHFDRNAHRRTRRRRHQLKHPDLVVPPNIALAEHQDDTVCTDLNHPTPPTAPATPSLATNLNTDPQLNKPPIESPKAIAERVKSPDHLAADVLMHHSSAQSPASSFCTKSPSGVSTPPNNLSANHPIDKLSNQPSLPSHRVTPHLSSPQKSEGDNLVQDQRIQTNHHAELDSRERVVLQFVSPSEQRLMASLTYSLPVFNEPDNAAKQHVDSDQSPSKVKQDVFHEDGIRVQGFDLEFRSVKRPFDIAFDDRDNRDDLRSEILRLSTVLDDLVPQTKPLRNVSYAAAKAAIDRQDRLLEFQTEEKQIFARLKEIEKEKAAAKARAKAMKKVTSSKAIVQSRRPARIPSPTGRQRRPSRKIQVELDSDDERSGFGEENFVLTSEPPFIGKLRQSPEADKDSSKEAKVTPLAVARPPTSNIAVGTGAAKPLDTIVTSKQESARAAEFSTKGSHVANVEESIPNSEDAVLETAHKDKSEASVVREPLCATKANPIESKIGIFKQVLASSEGASSSGYRIDAASQAERGSSNPSLVATKLWDSVTKSKDILSSSQVAIIPGVDSCKEGDSTVAYTSQEKEGRIGSRCEGLANMKIASSRKNLPDRKPSSRAIIENPEAVVDSPVLDRSSGTHDAEFSNTPATEIDLDVSPDSDDEARAKELSNATVKVVPISFSSTDAANQKSCPAPTQVADQLKTLTCPRTPPANGGRIPKQLVRMQSPVSPLQIANATCGFVVVRSEGPPTKVLTTGTALVDHMKAIDEDKKSDDLPGENNE